MDYEQYYFLFLYLVTTIAVTLVVIALGKRVMLLEQLLHATVDALRAEQAARLRFQHGRNWEAIIEATEEMENDHGQRH